MRNSNAISVSETKIESSKKSIMALLLCRAGVGTLMMASISVSSHAVSMSDGANSIHDKIRSLINEHPLAQVSSANYAASKSRIKADRALYGPSFALSGDVGRERIDREAVGQVSSMNTYGATGNLTQPIYDFGATSSVVAESKKSSERFAVEHSLQQQNLIYAAVDAHLNILRWRETANILGCSSDNVRKQADLEQRRLDIGRGRGIDLLRLRAQVAGANARETEVDGELSNAVARYSAVYMTDVVNVEGMNLLSIDASLMPDTLQDALMAAEDNNPDYLKAKSIHGVAKAHLSMVKKRAYAPRLDAVADYRIAENQDALAGYRREGFVGAKLNWKFNLFGRAGHEVREASNLMKKEKWGVSAILLQVKEEVRRSWNSVEKSRKRIIQYTEEEDLTRAFAEKIKKEHEVGKSSVSDVLTAETEWLIAAASLEAVKWDEKQAAVSLMRAMGVLQVSNLDRAVKVKGSRPFLCSLQS